MNIPSFKEDQISQIPALELLQCAYAKTQLFKSSVINLQMKKTKNKSIKKAHLHTKKDTLQRQGADLYVTQALQI